MDQIKLTLPDGSVKEVAAGTTGLEVAEDFSTSGGGSSPTSRIPTFVLRLRSSQVSVDELAHRLRTSSPRVLVRIADDAVLLDLRTVPEAEDATVAEAVLSALKS